MSMRKEARYEAAAMELEQELSEGFITQKQYNQYMRELEEDFIELFEGWDG